MGGDNGLEEGPYRMSNPINHTEADAGAANPFASSGLVRSYVAVVLHQQQQQQKQGQQQEQQLGQNELNKPPQKPKIVTAKRLVEELHNFVDGRNNVHKEIKDMVHKIRKALVSAVNEFDTAVLRADAAECALALTKAPAALAPPEQEHIGTADPLHPKKQGKEMLAGLESTSVSMTPKRARTSPGDGRPGGLKKQTREDAAAVGGTDATSQGSGWSTVVGQKEKRNKQLKRKEARKMEQNKKEKPPPRQKPPKGKPYSSRLTMHGRMLRYSRRLERIRS
ncbi:uncharacterized protein LOC134209772 [Armigeres subalbatus]|uniref:uncharacterized protein LOC134209772 n=1 Tax=Armigeres subalbatus TaxID=124917 RepID=UPI002ED18437